MKCTVLVGLPASGKSTYVKNFLIKTPNSFVYSTDQEIENLCSSNGLTYDEGFSKFVDIATKTANEKLEHALKTDQDIVWDQTNLGKKKRMQIVQKMKQNKYDVSCVVFMSPTEVDDVVEWNRRLLSRQGKTIPDHIMTNMVKSFSTPSLDEGYTELTFYDIYGNLYKGIN